MSIIREMTEEECEQMTRILAAQAARNVAANQAPSRADVRSINWVYDIAVANKEIVRLRRAIQETLSDNGHLADGDNCTLIKLKRAMSHTGVISDRAS